MIANPTMPASNHHHTIHTPYLLPGARLNPPPVGASEDNANDDGINHNNNNGHSDNNMDQDDPADDGSDQYQYHHHRAIISTMPPQHGKMKKMMTMAVDLRLASAYVPAFTCALKAHALLLFASVLLPLGGVSGLTLLLFLDRLHLNPDPRVILDCNAVIGFVLGLLVAVDERHRRGTPSPISLPVLLGWSALAQFHNNYQGGGAHPLLHTTSSFSTRELWCMVVLAILVSLTHQDKEGMGVQSARLGVFIGALLIHAYSTCVCDRLPGRAPLLTVLLRYAPIMLMAHPALGCLHGAGMILGTLIHLRLHLLRAKDGNSNNNNNGKMGALNQHDTAQSSTSSLEDGMLRFRLNASGGGGVPGTTEERDDRREDDRDGRLRKGIPLDISAEHAPLLDVKQLTAFHRHHVYNPIRLNPDGKNMPPPTRFVRRKMNNALPPPSPLPLPLPPSSSSLPILEGSESSLPPSSSSSSSQKDDAAAARMNDQRLLNELLAQRQNDSLLMSLISP